ncbi:MAG: PIN domain-containing protein [Nanoarchaeota archaeon]
MKKIILDTNFLMIPWQFRVDIFSEFDRICNFNYRLHIFEESINELRNIVSASSGKDKKAAEFALKLIKLKNISVIKSKKKDVDSSILEDANEDDFVATQDMQLKRELTKKGVSLIILRKKKYLILNERKLYK